MVVLAVLVMLSPGAITDVFILLQMSWDMVMFTTPWTLRGYRSSTWHCYLVNDEEVCALLYQNPLNFVNIILV